jgi:hypothetical protein
MTIRYANIRNQDRTREQCVFLIVIRMFPQDKSISLSPQQLTLDRTSL